MLCCGAPSAKPDHAERVLNFALDMFAALYKLRGVIGEDLDIRIGMNSGTLVGGVIGTSRMAFDIWGATVNLASRMESTGIQGKIQVTEATYQLLRDAAEFETREGVQVKGEGILTTHIFVRKKVQATLADSLFSAPTPSSVHLL
jgi:class 3 adenylate cyclase